MSRTGQFIQLYNQLDDHLGEIIGDRNYLPFSQKIERASRSNYTISREASRLQKYGELRNAIVHDKLYPSEVIAEPTEATLQRFRQIVQRIIAPKRLDTFQKPIRVFTPEEPLTTALHHMHTYDFSQV